MPSPATPRSLLPRPVPPLPVLPWARRALVAALAVLAAGCHWGTRPASFRPALGPEGASLVFRVRGERGERAGELFAVDSVGVTVLAPRLLRVAWGRLEWLDVERLDGDYDVDRGELPDAPKRARLALVSRFPQGLSDELLARVLARLPQAAREELR